MRHALHQPFVARVLDVLSSAAHPGGEAVPVMSNLKGKERAEEKIRNDYSGDAVRVKDYLRGRAKVWCRYLQGNPTVPSRMDNGALRPPSLTTLHHTPPPSVAGGALPRAHRGLVHRGRLPRRVRPLAR